MTYIFNGFGSTGQGIGIGGTEKHVRTITAPPEGKAVIRSILASLTDGNSVLSPKRFCTLWVIKSSTADFNALDLPHIGTLDVRIQHTVSSDAPMHLRFSDDELVASSPDSLHVFLFDVHDAVGLSTATGNLSVLGTYPGLNGLNIKIR